MATGRLCTEEGCGNPHMARGFCNVHYKRLVRRERAEARGTKAPSKGIAFIREAVASQTSECINWPFGLTSAGYGQIKFEGRMMKAHRLALIVADGFEPPPKVLALHQPGICHNPKCINPRHLRWGSHADNSADRVIDGTRVPGVTFGAAGRDRKLTDDQVRSIRSDPRMQKTLSELYGVSRATICHVKSRKKYANVI